MQGTQVWSLIGELRSHTPCSMAKKKKFFQLRINARHIGIEGRGGNGSKETVKSKSSRHGSLPSEHHSLLLSHEPDRVTTPPLPYAHRLWGKPTLLPASSTNFNLKKSIRTSLLSLQKLVQVGVCEPLLPINTPGSHLQAISPTPQGSGNVWRHCCLS